MTVISLFETLTKGQVPIGIKIASLITAYV